jgi:hypothetical protein
MCIVDQWRINIFFFLLIYFLPITKTFYSVPKVPFIYVNSNLAIDYYYSLFKYIIYLHDKLYPYVF